MSSRFTRIAVAAATALALAGTAAAKPVDADHPAVQQALAHVLAKAAAHANAAEQYVARDLVEDADGSRHVRFHRSFQGLKVIGGDFVVHLDRDGNWKGVSHAMKAGIALASVAPSLAAANVEHHAKAIFAGRVDEQSSQLVVYARDRAPVLAYDVRVAGVKPDGKYSLAHVILHAHTGELLDQWDEIQPVVAQGDGVSLYSGTVPLTTDFANGTYRLLDKTRGKHAVYDLGNKNGQFTNAKGTLYTDADNHWGDGVKSRTATSDAVDAAYGQSKTWDMYKTLYGRNGIADDGRGGYSRVHSQTGLLWYNAFWSDACFCMTYTSGLNSTDSPALLGMDVAGHEMTHGVTSNSAGLIYSKESGGLNEATSDIFGNMVEWFANNPNDKPDYTVGEQMGTPLRYMHSPNIDGASADCWYSGVGNIDVHYSSGPANHVFYLMAEGSKPTNGQLASPTCNAGDTKKATGNATVAGVGRDKAQRIWYRALTVHMTSNETFARARLSTIKASNELYGANSAESKAVAAAWTAVNRR